MLGSLCDTLDVYDYNDVTSRVKCYKVSSLGMLFQVGLGRKKQNRREEKQAILVQDGLSASLSASIHRFNQQKVKTNWKKIESILNVDRLLFSSLLYKQHRVTVLYIAFSGL